MEADGHWRSLRGDIDAYCFSVRGVRISQTRGANYLHPCGADVRTCKETSRWCDRSILDVRQSVDPTGRKGRRPVWSSRRGNHLGQRSYASAPTGRTYGRKRSDQIYATTLLQGGGPDADRQGKLLICQ